MGAIVDGAEVWTTVETTFGSDSDLAAKSPPDSLAVGPQAVARARKTEMINAKLQSPLDMVRLVSGVALPV